jgi:hypothetical protein
MKTFAVLDGTNVINTILCTSKAIAEDITGKTCVEYTVEPAEVGGSYISGNFIQRKPFPSWSLNSNNKWVPPVVYPENPEILESGEEVVYYWDEPTVQWQPTSNRE